ncbi:MAG TPA: Mini-ribonuclease 3 [Clostridiales bacterium]|jgi:ribonuclease-3 family protein|nr:Mini-ribonuclease 3 [Clostridiales bacterium]
MQNNYVPVFPQTMSKKEAFALNPLVLSFIGDSVHTLYVRSKLSVNLMQKTGTLHSLTAKEINAVSQSKAMKIILPILNEDENDIYKRARNSKTNSSAKNASINEYHIASGFEAIIGYLYLTGQNERLHYLLERAYLGIQTDQNGYPKE